MKTTFVKKLLGTALSYYLCNMTFDVSAQMSLNKMIEPNADFYQIRNQADSFWVAKTSLSPSDTGVWKQYARWANFWSPRVDANGSFLAYSKAIVNYVNSMQIGTSLRISSLGKSNWELLGPSQTTDQNLGIVVSIYMDPVNPNTIYVGTNASGLWRTDNATDPVPVWRNITDVTGFGGLGVQDIAVDPQNHNTMYIGTGISVYRRGYGIGVLKSLDGGNTWNNTGLSFDYDNNIKIEKLAIDPTNTNIIWAIGNDNVYKSINGGDSWDIKFSVPRIPQTYSPRFLIDIDLHPTDPNIVYVSCNTEGSVNGSVEIWKTINGGGDWVSLIDASLQSISSSNVLIIGVTPANPDLVYVLYGGSDIVQGNNPVNVYKSTDKGENWTFVSNTSLIQDFGIQHYQLEVSPVDENILYAGSVNLYKSTDGGLTFLNFEYTSSTLHMDMRAIQILQANVGGINDNILIGTDGGVSISYSGGIKYSFNNLNGKDLAITQFYGIGGIESNPDLLAGGTQDNHTFIYNSGVWKNVSQGDGGDCVIDYSNPLIMYGSQNGSIYKSVDKGNSWSNINGGMQGKYGDPYWVHFDFPIIMHPTTPNTLFVAKWDVHKTTNGGANWINLTTINKRFTALVVASSNPNYMYCAVEEPTRGSSSEERIWKSENGGATWTNITAGLSGLTYAAISDIEVHPNLPCVLWVTLSNFYEGSTGQQHHKVYYSSDCGATWSNYSHGLPNVPVNCIEYRKGTQDGLFIGTDIGIYYRENSWAQWEPFSKNLPVTIVNDLEINYTINKIRASTFGRGIWESNLPCNNFNTTPRVVNTTEFWNINQTINFDIHIESGGVLTMKGTYACLNDVDIIIKKGGKLILDNAVLTNACFEGMWQGIQVWGTTSIAHPNLQQIQSGSHPNQGLLIAKNNSVIENAWEAVSLNKINTDGSSDPALQGGIVLASNCTFRNNRRSVAFVAYEHPNRSKFTDCTFERTGFMKDPSADVAAMVTLWAVQDVKFQNCTFQNTASTSIFAGSNRGTGIFSIDAQYIVGNEEEGGGPLFPLPANHTNMFNGLYHGIEAQSSNQEPGTDRLQINGNTFTNLERSLLFQGVKFASVTGNTFNIAKPAVNNPTYGIYLNGCNGYKVESNVFNPNTAPASSDLQYGMIVHNSGSTPNEIYRNTINGINLGIQTQTDNSMLQIKCNDFSQTIKYNIIVGEPLVAFQASLPSQGYCEPDPINQDFYTAPAGNTFNLCNESNEHILTTQFATPFIYHAHPDRLPQSHCYNPAIVSVIECVGAYYVNGSPCPSTISTPISWDEINMAIIKIGIRIDAAQAKLIEGNRPILIQIIHDPSITPLKIKATLLAVSPYLSDVVLKVAIERTQPLPPDILKEIIIKNSPLTREVMETLEQRTPALPKTMMNEIRSVQTGESPRLLLEKEIKHLESERHLKTNELVRHHLSNNFPDSAVMVMELLNTIAAKCDLVDLCMRKKDITKAEQYMSELLAVQDPQPQMVQFLKERNVHLQLFKTNKTVFEMSSSQQQHIREVSDANVPVAARAKSVLALVFKEHYPEEIHPLPAASSLKTANQQTNETNANEDKLVLNQLRAYKDLSGNSLIIFYSIAGAYHSAELTLYDVLGRKINSSFLNDISQGQLDWIVPPGSGMYIIQLKSDYIPLITQKVFIVK